MNTTAVLAVLIALAALTTTTAAALLAIRRIAEAARALIDTTRKAMHESHAFAVQSMNLNHERLLHLTENAQVRAALKTQGLGPFLDPHGRAMDEIRAYAKQLGVSEDEAREWIAASIRNAAQKSSS